MCHAHADGDSPRLSTHFRIPNMNAFHAWTIAGIATLRGLVGGDELLTRVLDAIAKGTIARHLP